MATTTTARYQSLLKTIEDLYGRLHTGTLDDADMIDLEDLTWPNLDEFVARLYGDRVAFDAHFEKFKQPFDIFRAFSDAETVLDVGAHWGYSALAMRHQGCRARIVSVEAMAFNIPPLSRLKSIDGSHYDYVHAAASDRTGRLVFYVPVLNGCAASGLASTGHTLTPSFAMALASRATHFPPRVDGGTDEVGIAVQETHALPIDAILETLGPAGRHVAGMKMDVEGHEAAALTGATHLLRAQKPLLMVEGGVRYPHVADLIRSFGYFQVARVEGRLVPHDRHPRTTDGLWVHPDRTERYRGLGLFEGSVPAAA